MTDSIAKDIGRNRPHRVLTAAARVLPAVFKSHWLLQVTLVVSILAGLYWGFVASDRYVSEAHVVILSTDAAGKSADTASLITGSVSGDKVEQFLLRDHLRSVDMMLQLDRKLNLRSHFSDPKRDILSRMWSKDAALEQFYDYYLSRVSVEFDDYAGVLVIKAQAFDRATAHAIADMLVKEGERAMNVKARELAQEQVDFAQQQVAHVGTQLEEARQALIAYQNKYGLVSPENTVESLASNINRLETSRTELQARRNAMLGYLAPEAPAVVDIDMQLRAIESQLVQEQKRLTAKKGPSLNSVAEEYQRLQMMEKFAEDEYKAALSAVARTRIEATRTLRKVLVLQSPTQPQYAVQPRRLYNIIVSVLAIFLLAGIVHLLAAIIRDHKD